MLRHTSEASFTGLDPEHSPYLLVNTTMNVPRSVDPTGRARKSEHFVFSRRFYGSRLTGYMPTHVLERRHSSFVLASAVAISGAAVAPNMGVQSSHLTALVMATLNARLGFWLDNPARGRGFVPRRVGPMHLFKEAFGLLDERGRFVNVSDGGHLENMGIYELVQRRCRLIVCGDAEADGTMTFGGLADAIRMVQIDMGIKIEIDLSDVAVGPDGLSKKHYAVGTIHYEGEIGHLLYLKSSVTATQGTHERTYRSRHPAFPHESTGDQAYDEAQFEAYRSLGHRVATSALLDDPAMGPDGKRLSSLLRTNPDAPSAETPPGTPSGAVSAP